jgi:hypothetical protein
MRWRRFRRGNRRISSITRRRALLLLRRGGKVRGAVGFASDYPQGSDERYAVGVDVGIVRGFDHEGADGVVGRQYSPDFLPHHLRRFRSQHAGVRDLVGLDLIEGDLEFPTPVIGGGQVRGERVFPVGDGGDQPVDLAARVAVGDLVFQNRTMTAWFFVASHRAWPRSVLAPFGVITDR